ncbi:AtpZ/AtpI family protein [Candidatus Korobacter versatilis]|uniref:AtpZ/AtpI family protein n=1 Tax=Candidatus Korobacter versatilis TaxID=658062 RepID=UPI0002D4D82B|nr:AtpZ/AtpI family protein [Candidatus Koribacter versatilis]
MAEDDNRKAAYTWARYSQIAFIIPGAVVAGLILGALVDKWLHTHWAYIAGVIVGAVGGFIQLVRTLTSASDKD